MDTITVCSLTDDTLPAFLEFFDRDAMSDEPHWWGHCYCYALHYRGTLEEWDQRTPADNRASTCGMIAEGRTSGVLAFIGDEVVGWCHAGQRDGIPYIAANPAYAVDESQTVGAIVCFVVAPEHRGKGVARELLRGACDHLHRLGCTHAEAYPVTGASEADYMEGPLGLYLSEGFSVFREIGQRRMVRRPLGADTAQAHTSG